MHILFITRKYPPVTGGMETFSWELTQRFPGGQKRILAYPQRKQWHIIWVLPLLFVRALFSLRDITHIHLGDLVLAPLAILLRLLGKRPIIATVHGLELTYHNRILRALINASLHSITHFVAVSTYTRDLLVARGIHPEHITIITHGVDIPATIDNTQARQRIYELVAQHTTTQSIHTHSDTLFMLTTGRHVRRKGFVWFIETVLPQLRQLNYIYLITSSGPDTNAIQAAIERQHLQDRVVLLGTVSTTDLSALYSGCDLFIMPNIPVANDAEGFGFVAIEAAAHGAAVIASDIEGIPSAIEHGRNGILLEPMNATVYARTINELAASPQQRQALGTSAREYIAQHRTWKHAVEQYLQLFQNIHRL